MVATNDDLLAVLNEIKNALKPVTNVDNTQRGGIFHDGIEVELNISDGKYYPKK